MDYLNEQDYEKIKALAESKGCEYDKYYAIKSFDRLVEEEKLDENKSNALLDFCKKYAV